MSEYDAFSTPTRRPAPAENWDAFSRPSGPTAGQLEAQRAAQREADRKLYAADKDMSGLEKFAVGAGASADKAWRGITGLFGADTSEGDEDAKLYAKHRPEGWQTTAGEIAGDVGAYAPLALVAPVGLGAGAVARQVALGAAGGAALTPGDLKERAEGAGWGAGGAAAGHALARTLGRVAAPIGDKAADVVALERAGVRPTLGQSMAAKPGFEGAIGKGIRGLEDIGADIPVGGLTLRARRADAMDQWRTATRKAALPPGVAKGEAKSLDSLRSAWRKAYSETLEPHQLPYEAVTYKPDMQALSRGVGATAEQKKLAEEMLDGLRMKYMANPKGVQPTAEAAHAITSDLKAQARKFASGSDAAGQNMGELLGNMADDFGRTWKGALPPKTRADIESLDAAYAGFVPVREAGIKVAPGKSGATPENYNPNDLLRAIRKAEPSATKPGYLRGDRPQQALATAGEKALAEGGGNSPLVKALVKFGSLPGAHAAGVLPTAALTAAGLTVGSKVVQNYLNARTFPAAQQAARELARRLARPGAAAGAGIAADKLNTQEEN